MKDPTHQADVPSPTEEAEALLRRIGWHPSDWKQVEVYARMSPARKVSLMLRWRHEMVALLKARLRREHPGCSDAELAHMLLEHLALVRDDPTNE